VFFVLPVVLWCLRVQVANTYLKERCRVLASLLICLWLKCCCCLLQVNGRQVMFHPAVVLPSLSLGLGSVFIYAVVVGVFAPFRCHRHLCRNLGNVLCRFHLLQQLCGQLWLASSSWRCLGLGSSSVVVFALLQVTSFDV
jgi:hypothetical protein